MKFKSKISYLGEKNSTLPCFAPIFLAPAEGWWPSATSIGALRAPTVAHMCYEQTGVTNMCYEHVTNMCYEHVTNMCYEHVTNICYEQVTNICYEHFSCKKCFF